MPVDPSSDDAEVEMDAWRSGAALELNPYFGAWRKHFRFTPVSYSASARARHLFRDHVHSEIKTQYVLTQPVGVEVTLFLQAHIVEASDRYADLDNYAKSIFDAIKGPQGVLIDDCQIKSFTISWIPANEAASFIVDIRGPHDEFALKQGLTLYEMLDHLYYPASGLFWNNAVPIAMNTLNHYASLLGIQHGVTNKRRLSNASRRPGVSMNRSHQIGRFIGPIALGYHKNRALASGFRLVEYGDWQAALNVLLETESPAARELRELVAAFASDGA